MVCPAVSVVHCVKSSNRIAVHVEQLQSEILSRPNVSLGSAQYTALVTLCITCSDCDQAKLRVERLLDMCCRLGQSQNGLPRYGFHLSICVHLLRHSADLACQGVFLGCELYSLTVDIHCNTLA